MPMRRSRSGRSRRATAHRSAAGLFRTPRLPGTLTIRDVSGKPIASIFYIAYTADGAASGRTAGDLLLQWRSRLGVAVAAHGLVRPGARADRNPESTRPAPFTFVDNPDTLLDKSDLVFLDAIGAGYSRPLGDTKGSDFCGVDQDIDAFARGIQRYVT